MTSLDATCTRELWLALFRSRQYLLFKFLNTSPMLTAVFVSWHRMQAPALRTWSTSFLRQRRNISCILLPNHLLGLGRARRNSPRTSCLRSFTNKVPGWPSSGAVESEAAVDAKPLSSWEVSDPVRFRLVCGASTSESFPVGDMQTRSLKVIQVMGLVHVLVCGMVEGVTLQRLRWQVKKVLAKEVKVARLGAECPIFHYGLRMERKGCMQWGKCADTQRTIARSRSA